VSDSRNVRVLRGSNDLYSQASFPMRMAEGRILWIATFSIELQSRGP